MFQAERLSLTSPEMVGLQTAFEVIRNAAYYFGLALMTFYSSLHHQK
jgi:hypothetical protein